MRGIRVKSGSLLYKIYVGISWSGHLSSLEHLNDLKLANWVT